MEQVISFLEELAQHNYKEWFDAHKGEYLKARDTVAVLAAEMISRLGAIDPRVRGLRVEDCTYRIYRDLRFSQDKTPYKTHMGIYVCAGGKKSGRAGYYLHIEPAADTFFLCSGLYNPTKEIVKSVREEIMLSGGGFDAAIKASKGFTLDWEGSLSRIPSGWPESPYKDYYRLRSYLVMKDLDRKYLTGDNLAARIVRDLKPTVPFCEILNRCVDYAFENDIQNEL